MGRLDQFNPSQLRFLLDSKAPDDCSFLTPTDRWHRAALLPDHYITMTVRHGHNVVVIKESRTELIELYMACCTSWIMPCTELYMLLKFRVRFSQKPMIHFGDNEITHYEPQIIKLNACMKLYYMQSLMCRMSSTACILCGSLVNEPQFNNRKWV